MLISISQLFSISAKTNSILCMWLLVPHSITINLRIYNIPEGIKPLASPVKEIRPMGKWIDCTIKYEERWWIASSQWLWHSQEVTSIYEQNSFGNPLNFASLQLWSHPASSLAKMQAKFFFFIFFFFHRNCFCFENIQKSGGKMLNFFASLNNGFIHLAHT